MTLTIKTTKNINDPAEFISHSILNNLKLNKHVLFFVTGGSSIDVCVKISEILKDHQLKNLTVMLTDERYGPVGHSDSNWHKLIQKGFNLSGAKLFPMITGEEHRVSAENYNKILVDQFKNSEYKIGLFGIGADGHTAGILPESIAVNDDNLVCGYETKIFSRITITPKAIEKLDEAVAWVQGEEKWKVLKDLEKNIFIERQPAQVLKKVPLLTIFTDYKVE